MEITTIWYIACLLIIKKSNHTNSCEYILLGMNYDYLFFLFIMYINKYIRHIKHDHI